MSLRTSRLAVFALACLAYAPVLRLGFMIDDPFLIPQAPVSNPWTAEFFKHCFSAGLYTHGGGTAYFRPLFTLLLYTGAWLWGTHPLGYHAVALLFHGLNAVLVVELIARLGCSRAAAILVGALFAVHPIIVGEMMPAAASGMMALCFMLASVLALTQPKRAVFFVGCLLYVLALLTKESNIVIPCLVALFLYARRSPRRATLRLVPLVACWPIYLLVLFSRGGFQSHAPLTLVARFYLHAFPSIALRLASLAILPWNLMSWRALPAPTALWPLYWACFLGLIVLFHRRGLRWAVFSLGWFVITLSPCVMAITLHQSLMDQWAYPGLVALLLPLGILADRVLSARPSRLRRAAAAVYAGLLLAGIGLIALNIARRGSDEKNFKWTFEHFPEADFAKRRFLAILIKEHRLDEARVYVDRFHNENPADPDYALLARTR